MKRLACGEAHSDWMVVWKRESHLLGSAADHPGLGCVRVRAMDDFRGKRSYPLLLLLPALIPLVIHIQAHMYGFPMALDLGKEAHIPPPFPSMAYQKRGGRRVRDSNGKRLLSHKGKKKIENL